MDWKAKAGSAKKLKWLAKAAQYLGVDKSHKKI
jgi:hypothetical protein